ncbi:hypothetical protein IV203_014526 [Nitzschia inconspicua]|uniref:Uncharacterized protein n=1 Tax=Nitzschia inconspicua TaxID=303405 RepID=A0A9K3LA02_9STRA|nr:hypothetical protein IV203_014526 [Nitzschia inconspicua]
MRTSGRSQKPGARRQSHCLSTHPTVWGNGASGGKQSLTAAKVLAGDDRGVGGGAIEGEDPRRLAHSHCQGTGNTVGNKSATTGNIVGSQPFLRDGDTVKNKKCHERQYPRRLAHNHF